MPSLFAGTNRLICNAFSLKDRKHLRRKTHKVAALSDENAFRLVQDLYCCIADNFMGHARSSSKELWRCTRETGIGDHNRSREKILEKAVVILADQGHMPGWYNQCPVATGIADPQSDTKRSIDLVHLSDDTLRLVELKWNGGDTPPLALFEVLEYGLAYLLARLYRRELDLETRPFLQDCVRHVRLEVVGPRAFFAGDDHRDLFSRMDNALAKFSKAKTNGEWSMSLHTLVFPDHFHTLPFASGKAAKEACCRATPTPQGQLVRDAFASLAPLSARGKTLESWTGRFLPGVPGADIERILDDAPGNELETGKFDRPTSSAALAVNAFGYFLHRPADLPPLPGLERAGWPAHSLSLEKTIRFPWRGGRHPVPDCLVATGSTLIGIESKRFEPFRDGSYADFSETFWRPVWGERMAGYQHVRDLLRANKKRYKFLDAAQLVKHALALYAIVQPENDHDGLRPHLLYVYAEPDAWPETGRQVDDDEKARHREEIASFANQVAGAEVTFSACSYGYLLDAWSQSPNQGIARHAAAIIDRFAP